MLVGLERLCLAAGAVERDHELAAEALAQRILLHEAFELHDHTRVLSEGELGLDSGLDRCQAKLLEAADLALGERLVGEL